MLVENSRVQCWQQENCKENTTESMKSIPCTRAIAGRPVREIGNKNVVLWLLEEDVWKSREVFVYIRLLPEATNFSGKPHHANHVKLFEMTCMSKPSV